MFLFSRMLTLDMIERRFLQKKKNRIKHKWIEYLYFGLHPISIRINGKVSLILEELASALIETQRLFFFL